MSDVLPCLFYTNMEYEEAEIHKGGSDKLGDEPLNNSTLFGEMCKLLAPKCTQLKSHRQNLENPFGGTIKGIIASPTENYLT